MIKYVFIALLLCACAVVCGQKPALDTAVLANWPTIFNQSISPGGDYVSYSISTPSAPAVWYLQSVTGDFKINFAGGTDGAFTADGKRFICRNPGDSLYVFDLGTRKGGYRRGVQSYKIPDDGNGCWLGYLSAGGSLIMEDLCANRSREYHNVQDFQFSANGKIGVLQGVDSVEGGSVEWLQWIDLAGGKEVTLCRGEQTDYVSFNSTEDGLAFIASQGGRDRGTSVVRLYRSGMDSAVTVVGARTPGVESGLVVAQDQLEFSLDGEKLFFTLHRPTPIASPTRLGANVDVWNYKDEYPQFEQLNDPDIDELSNFRAVLEIRNGKVLRLQQVTDGGNDIRAVNVDGGADFFLTATRYNSQEEGWRKNERPILWLVNTNDGTRKELSPKAWYYLAQFSPGGNYVVWFNRDKQAYFTYNVRTGVCRNISRMIPGSLTDELHEGRSSGFLYGLMAWLKQDSAVLVYDRYDIWKVDPEGMLAPVNLTNGFGREHKIQFRGVYTSGKNYRKEIVIQDSEDLILCALGDQSKNNGFYTINLHRPRNPAKLVMSPKVYYFSGVSWTDFPLTIYKASRANRYLMTRSSEAEYPNLMVTGDFIHFEMLTDLEPQRNYNWLTTELLQWKTFSGHTAEGILYKPEDFDPKKKYAIVFYYYERKSDGLHLFHPAELADGPMNIPWMVSRGYLVFVPDIRYTPGDVGAGVYDYVVSAARMMQEKPWVDGMHMGIQGHSFGGFETNYLVTRTKLFAAAVSSAGLSNLIDFGEVNEVHAGGYEDYVQNGQLRMVYPYWQRPDLYLRNSPVFHVDKVVTPLLLTANRNDRNVQWQQGEELFMALRRLGKPVWMLQYTPDSHYMGGNNALDYTLRMTQFFDHYLKGWPEPKWMREGIAARLKGREDGLGF